MKAASTFTGFLSAIAVIGAFSFVILYLPGASDTPVQALDASQQSATKESQPADATPRALPSEPING